MTHRLPVVLVTGMFTGLFVLMVFAAPQSTSTAYSPETTADLAKEAQVIARGKVRAMKSEWNDEKTYIWTFVTLAVSDTVKGADMRGKEIQIKIPGGVVGDIGQRQSNQVTFQEGEDVVVFLGRETYRAKEYFTVVHQVHGKFTVEAGKIRGKPVETFVQEIKRAVQP